MIKLDENLEKAKTLVTHWINHNSEHKADFEKWAEKLSNLGAGKTSTEIYNAAKMMDKVNEHLTRALTVLGE